MENLPVENQPEPETVEVEVVGFEPKPPLWRRILARLGFGLLLAILGVGLILVGAVLTISIIGAAIGIPLVFIGLFFIIAALFVTIGGGRKIN